MCKRSLYEIVYYNKIIISSKLKKSAFTQIYDGTMTRTYLLCTMFVGKINNPCNLGALVTMETIETDLLT